MFNTPNLSTIQRIILIAAAVILIAGTVMILFSDKASLSEIIVFYVGIGVPSALFYFAFSPSKKEQNQPEDESLTPKDIPSQPIQKPEPDVKPQEIPEKKPENQDTKKIKKQTDEFMKEKPIMMNTRKDVNTQQLTMEHPEKANQTLLTLKQKGMFQMFPDTVIIEEKSISIIHKSFIKLAQVQTIPIMDIAAVQLYTGPIYAALGIKTKSAPEEIEINNLEKNDALKAKQTLDGLILVTEKVIDVPSTLPLTKKQELIERAGSTPAVSEEVNS